MFGPLKKNLGSIWPQLYETAKTGSMRSHVHTCRWQQPSIRFKHTTCGFGGRHQVEILPWGHLTCWLHGGGTWPAAPTGVGKPLVLFLPLHWSERVDVFLNGMFLYFIPHHCRRLVPFSWSNLINSTMMEVPVWTAPASDGQLEPDSTPNSLFNMFTQDNLLFQKGT